MVFVAHKVGQACASVSEWVDVDRPARTPLVDSYQLRGDSDEDVILYMYVRQTGSCSDAVQSAYERFGRFDCVLPSDFKFCPRDSSSHFKYAVVPGRKISIFPPL